MELSYPNKYFTASYEGHVEHGIGMYSNIVFLRDIGPFKAGDAFPTGYVGLLHTKEKLKLIIEMNTELEPHGACPFVHEVDVFNFV